MWFFDESRFGTHSKIGHGWFKTGKRTAVKIKLGFKNFYLYSAVNPKTGDEFTLLLPYVNTQCMNIFLKLWKKEIGNRAIKIVMDGAAWHKSKELKLPENIKPIILPPYSPELNPVEKLWQHIKDNTIKNKVYEKISDLEDTVCGFIKTLESKIIKSVCNVRYLAL